MSVASHGLVRLALVFIKGREVSAEGAASQQGGAGRIVGIFVGRWTGVTDQFLRTAITS